MLRKLFDTNLCVGKFIPNSVTRVVSSEMIEENGVLIRKSFVKDFNVCEESKQFDYRDFNVQNLLQVGAYKENLVVMSANTEFNAVDLVSSLPVRPVESNN